jgi:hypothetical protein
MISCGRATYWSVVSNVKCFDNRPRYSCEIAVCGNVLKSNSICRSTKSGET